VKVQSADMNTAKVVRLLQDHVEYRRKVARRGVDDAENLGDRLLLFQ